MTFYLYDVHLREILLGGNTYGLTPAPLYIDELHKTKSDNAPTPESVLSVKREFEKNVINDNSRQEDKEWPIFEDILNQRMLHHKPTAYLCTSPNLSIFVTLSAWFTQSGKKISLHHTHSVSKGRQRRDLTVQPLQFLVLDGLSQS